MTKRYKQKLIKLADLKEYEQNSRTHSPEQIKQIERSMQEFGFTNPVLVDENNEIIAGHARCMAAANLGEDKVPCVVVDGLTQHQKAALVIADNKLALNAGWNFDALKSELNFLDEVGFDLSLTGFDAEELGSLMEMEGGELDLDGDDDDNPYTDKVDGIQYEPHNEKPDLADVYDTTKFDELTGRIEKADLPDDVRYFLELAATRHVQFNYQLVADFYAHAEPEIQKLMEDSALVVLDYDDAIEKGYIKLSEQIAEQYKNDKAKHEA